MTDRLQDLIQSDFDFKVPPFKHQYTDFMLQRGMEYAGIMGDPGTGKSKMLLDQSAWLFDKGKIDALVVLAPKGVYRNWFGEIAEHLPDRIPRSTAAWSANPKAIDRKALEGHLGQFPGLKILLMNIEAISTSKGADYLESFLLKHDAILAIDESTSIKNSTSIRGKTAKSLGRLASYRRVLTGGSVDNSPLDIYGQMDFLSPRILGYSSFVTFRRAHAKVIRMKRADVDLAPCAFCKGEGLIKKGGGLYDTCGVCKGSCKEPLNMRNSYETIARDKEGAKVFENMDRLREAIAPYCFFVKKEDCLDLPPKVYSTRTVEMTPVQKGIYEQMRQKAIVELEELYDKSPEVTADADIKAMTDYLAGNGQDPSILELVPAERRVTTQIVITKLLRLQQISCGFMKTDDGVERAVDTHNPLLEELMEALEQVSGKAIIWADFRYSIKEIYASLCKAYGPESVVLYYGDTTDEERDAARITFQDPNSPVRWFLGNPQTGGRGLTLTASSNMFFFSNSFDNERRNQAEARQDRIGQKAASVHYTDFIIPGTVITKILAALKEKRNLAASLTASNWRELLAA